MAGGYTGSPQATIAARRADPGDERSLMMSGGVPGTAFRQPVPPIKAPRKPGQSFSEYLGTAGAVGRLEGPDIFGGSLPIGVPVGRLEGPDTEVAMAGSLPTTQRLHPRWIQENIEEWAPRRASAPTFLEYPGRYQELTDAELATPKYPSRWYRTAFKNLQPQGTMQWSALSERPEDPEDLEDFTWYRHTGGSPRSMLVDPQFSSPYEFQFRK